jgi:hypothetical protein
LGEFGDGGDEAVGFVEDELFDEGLRGWRGLGYGFGRGLFAGQKRVEDLAAWTWRHWKRFCVMVVRSASCDIRGTPLVFSS